MLPKNWAANLRTNFLFAKTAFIFRKQIQIERFAFQKTIQMSHTFAKSRQTTKS